MSKLAPYSISLNQSINNESLQRVPLIARSPGERSSGEQFKRGPLDEHSAFEPKSSQPAAPVRRTAELVRGTPGKHLMRVSSPSALCPLLPEQVRVLA